MSEAVEVAPEHLEIRHHVVRQGDGLRLLQVGIAGHDGVQVVLRNVQQDAEQLAEHLLRLLTGKFGVHAAIQRHLIVAAAPGVQAFARFADALGQQGLHVHVDVLRVHHPVDFARLDVRQNPAQAFDNLVRVRLRDNALFAQHRRVGNRAGNILLRQPLIKRNAGMEIVHQPVGCLAEASSPEFHCVPPDARASQPSARKISIQKYCTVFPGACKVPCVYFLRTYSNFECCFTGIFVIFDNFR